ncbi:MAG: methyltransferase domain-containing protein [Anaerolineae bacterium]|nr:methyltransferase domain-containing protein [Anaerolineae bacterium]
MTDKLNQSLTEALWKIYNRPDSPEPWAMGGNLPWDDPDFSKRMLREHLDESHGAATRVTKERLMQIDWMWKKLGLQPGARLLDVTCGPGLYAVEFARRGCEITGIDFGPASIAYAQNLARSEGVANRCTFVQQDVRHMDYGNANFDAATFIYGQLAVFKREEARALLAQIASALKPGGKLCVELLNQNRVDKKHNTWWFTDNKGLWGNRPFLHLGERFWNEEEKISIERFHLIHLETGKLDQITLCDQTYVVETMVSMMKQAGFAAVEVYPAWDNLPLYDAEEWIVYVASKTC